MAAFDDFDDDARADRFADNEDNTAIDTLFIVAQHDGFKWAHECRFVKDLCRATRAENGLWSAMTRVHYGKRKRTLLMFEAYHGRLERVRWLLARGAPRDAACDRFGQTALHVACLRGHIDIVRELIAADAGVNIRDLRGWTPLHSASIRGLADIVRVLIAGGADINIVNIDTVRALLEAVAAVDITDNDGLTPLYYACYNGQADIVLALIAAGADVNLADERGRTLLDVAMHFSHESIVNTLIEAGASDGTGYRRTTGNPK